MALPETATGFNDALNKPHLWWRRFSCFPFVMTDFLVCHFLSCDFFNIFSTQKRSHSLCKECPNMMFFLSVFSRIWTEYGNLGSKSPYSVQIRENTDQKKLRIWTLFTQWLLWKESAYFPISWNLSLYLPMAQCHNREN